MSENAVKKSMSIPLVTDCRGEKSTLTSQLIRFGVIGGAAVAIDAILYIYLSPVIGESDGKACSYFAGMIWGFFGNKFWTFQSTARSAREPLVYVVFYGFTLVLNVLCNKATLDFCTLLGVGDAISKSLGFVVATGITTILNFIGLKYIAFRQQKNIERG